MKLNLPQEHCLKCEAASLPRKFKAQNKLIKSMFRFSLPTMVMRKVVHDLYLQNICQCMVKSLPAIATVIVVQSWNKFPEVLFISLGLVKKTISSLCTAHQN